MIGVFDSGFGGLTILKDIRRKLPQYDYLYLGDNARAPYGTRSFDVVYEYTLEAVKYLFSQGCRLVVLACNTASAKALRTIQQRDLPTLVPVADSSGLPSKRVLGIIRPTAESVGLYTKNGHVGVLATPGTVASESYPIEIHHLLPEVVVTQQACPMWVPIVENAEFDGDGADYFVEKYLNEIFLKDPEIDTLILACTHYPLLMRKIEKALQKRREAGMHPVCLLAQGRLVAESLSDYLNRHQELEKQLSKGGNCSYLTTESENKFAQSAAIFMGEDICVKHIDL